ncbi:MAG: VWA domain-containing protein [Deltaproteobacteria bacterium]|jgi:Ca-activated chloride channel family protein|nr:VWA domain-containing protein [Deltaproteobacteria bacterium]
MSALAEFHFLRPLWLLAMLPAALILCFLWLERSEQLWRRLIEPHLLASLTIETGESRALLRPAPLLALFWLLAALAMAGPAWEHEPSPFGDERAAIVLTLYVGESMLAEDVRPTRIERAVHKIRDLLALRPGTPVALVAYAGTAHTVLPFTTDHRLVEQMAGELSPEIMPSGGNAVVEAVRLGAGLLAESEQPGRLLLITDGVAPDAIAELETTGARAEILALGSPPDAPVPTSGPPAPALDRATLGRAARALGGSLVEVSVDDRDVDLLARRLERRVAIVGGRDRVRWRDAGSLLLLPLALVLMPFYRSGWGIRWGSG